jgi:hypothetical protein
MHCFFIGFSILFVVMLAVPAVTAVLATLAKTMRLVGTTFAASCNVFGH